MFSPNSCPFKYCLDWHKMSHFQNKLDLFKSVPHSVPFPYPLAKQWWSGQCADTNFQYERSYYFIPLYDLLTKVEKEWGIAMWFQWCNRLADNIRLHKHDMNRTKHKKHQIFSSVWLTISLRMISIQAYHVFKVSSLLKSIDNGPPLKAIRMLKWVWLINAEWKSIQDCILLSTTLVKTLGMAERPTEAPWRYNPSVVAKDQELQTADVCQDMQASIFEVNSSGPSPLL